jgi:nitrogen fixation/metabolism regulation signal transduction histidine kinase
MSTAITKERVGKTSSRLKSRITGAFYLVSIASGIVVLFAHGRLGLALDFIAAACYVAVTVLFYEFSR